MKRLLIGSATAIFAISAMATAAAASDTLPGVSDHETSFQHDGTRGVAQYFLGHDDVIFVRARTNRWYRIALNDGCLSGRTQNVDTISFDADGGNRVDRSSLVRFDGDSPRTCVIDSIRRSAPPPQVDSHSPVTLD